MRERPDRVDGMEERTPQLPADHPQSLAQRLAKFAKPALIAGVVVAVVCGVLLMIIGALDAFNSTVYSVDGKSIRDETEEARQIRDLYVGARTGGIVVLVLALVSAVAGGVLLYLNRNEPEAGDINGDEDVDFEDLGR